MRRYIVLMISVILICITGCMRLTTYEEKEQSLMGQKETSIEYPAVVPLLKVK